MTTLRRFLRAVRIMRKYGYPWASAWHFAQE